MYFPALPTGVLYLLFTVTSVNEMAKYSGEQTDTDTDDYWSRRKLFVTVAQLKPETSKNIEKNKQN